MLEPNVDASFRQLVAALAGPDPLPAGGAAAVAAIAMGAGLGIKVIRISTSASNGLEPTRQRLQELLERLQPEFAEDCASFASLLEVLRRPRDVAGREAALQHAWQHATAAPVRVAILAREVATLLSSCADDVKPSVRADLEAALELVRAGRRIAEGNARENGQRIDARLARELLAPLGDGEERTDDR